MTDEAGDRARRTGAFVLQRRSLRLWLLLGVGLWLAAVGGLVLDAKTNIDAARGNIDVAVPAAKEGDLDTIRVELTTGADRLRRARDDLFHPVLLPLRPLPIVGRQLRTARAMADVGADAATEAERLLALVDAATTGDAATTDDAGDVEEPAPSALASIDLVAVESSLHRLYEMVRTADLGPSEGLIGPLADARAEVDELLDRYEPSLGEAAEVASGLRSFQQDSRYVILGANNAEMQVGGGMVLSVGEVALGDDGVEFGGLLSTEDLFPVPSNGLVDADVDERWGFLQPTNDFRKLGLTPRFDEYVGPQAIAMWEAETGRPVDGAILVDAYALSRLLGVVGTVEVGGTTYDEERLLRYLLQDQYTEFGASEVEQARRRAKLSEVTSAVLDALVAGPHDLPRIVETVPSLLRGRHVLVYGDKAVEQRAWQVVGADGGTSGDELGVFVSNMGASKLDPYVEADVVVEESPGPEVTSIAMAVTVSNRVEQGDRLPEYVVGPWEWIDVEEPGEYLGRLVVRLPGATSAARFTSAVPLEVFGPDGDGVLLGTRFAVRPGRSTTIRLVFEVSSELESMQIVPSARPVPIRWQWGDRSFDDAEVVDQPLQRP
ncbi:MAG: DUF4012 domain-containing protein [Acidimicrobiales bacterium]